MYTTEGFSPNTLLFHPLIHWHTSLHLPRSHRQVTQRVKQNLSRYTSTYVHNSISQPRNNTSKIYVRTYVCIMYAHTCICTYVHTYIHTTIVLSHVTYSINIKVFLNNWRYVCTVHTYVHTYIPTYVCTWYALSCWFEPKSKKSDFQTVVSLRTSPIPKL